MKLPNRRPQRRTALATAALTSLAPGLAPTVHAGGFALIEHGASGMGNAYAGAAAVAHDSSTIWFNPAGMTELEGRELAVGLHVLATDTDFTNRGTSLNADLPGTGGAPVPGDEFEGGVTSVLPNLYYTSPINERWRYGLAIGAPFGSSTEYDDGWVGRYGSLESGIEVLDINPSISYRLSDRVRLGAGISIQRLTANLTSAIDSSVACFGSVGSVDLAPCIDNGLDDFGNPALDSRGEVTGDSTALTFNLGALFLPREGTRIGVAYRSGTNHELDGDGDFTVNPTLAAVLAGAGTDFLSDTGATAEVDLPATVMLSLAQEIGSRVDLLADVTWTGWSSFEELRVVFDNENQPDTLSLQEWNDVVRVSAGVNYRLNDALTLRTGVAFDEEAIPSPERRTPRIPGNDRTWVSLGLGYDIGRATVDVGYAHLFLPETAIDNDGAESPGSTTIRGEYDSSVDIFSAQLTWHFN